MYSQDLEILSDYRLSHDVTIREFKGTFTYGNNAKIKNFWQINNLRAMVIFISFPSAFGKINIQENLIIKRKESFLLALISLNVKSNKMDPENVFHV